jgi:acetylornithine deacetylase
LDDLTRLLSNLVAIPSVNPMGRPLGGSGLLEAGVSDFIETWLRERGIACERVTIAPGRDNLIARYDAPNSRRTILFDAHQDTVPVDGMTIPPFTPTIENGRLYGRGSCDIKGGLAAMLIAFARLVRERPSGSASVVMACTVDEEFTHIGSSALGRWNHGASLAIVAEPTKLDLVDRHKGAIRWKIRTRGVSCHSSTPHLGENAIYRMAEVLDGLRAHARELAGSPPDLVLGPPSLSVGRIEGGQSVNVVPDWCEVEVDRRVIPGEPPGDCPRRVLEALASTLGDLNGVEFDPPWVEMPPLAPGLAEPFLPALREAVSRIRGQMPAVLGVPYGTDGGPLSQAGLPCVVFGPGDIAQAHTRDEWVELDQVRLAAEIYFEMARELG